MDNEDTARAARHALGTLALLEDVFGGADSVVARRVLAACRLRSVCLLFLTRCR